jgi:anti-sigma factor RsiW
MSAREPHPDELLAMAYVDGELAVETRTAFEQRLASEPALRREVSELQALAVLARHAAPPEPMDHEWAALARDPLQRATLGVGWLLLLIGCAGLAGYTLYTLWSEPVPLPVKLLVSCIVLGLTLLLGATARGRLRTVALDPYEKIQR